MKQPAVAHKLVASVAREAAGQLYEKLMSDNELWLAWKRQNPELGPKALEARFVARNAEKCLAFARATLAAMLRSPGLDPATGDMIMEALALDQTLPGRVPHQRAVEIINPAALRQE